MGRDGSSLENGDSSNNGQLLETVPPLPPEKSVCDEIQSRHAAHAGAPYRRFSGYWLREAERRLRRCDPHLPPPECD